MPYYGPTLPQVYSWVATHPKEYAASLEKLGYTAAQAKGWQQWSEAVSKGQVGPFKDRPQWFGLEKEAQLEALSPAQRHILKVVGPEKFEQIIKAQAKELPKYYIQVGPEGQWVPKSAWKELTPVMQGLVERGGLQAISLEGLTGQQVFNRYVKWGKVPEGSEYVEGSYEKHGKTGQVDYKLPGDIEEGDRPWHELAGGPPGVPYVTGALKPGEVKAGAIFTTEALIPGLFLARHWKDLPNWERALWIGVDLLAFIPALRIASAARRAGFALPQAIKQTALAMAVAPVSTIAMPKQTAKVIIYPLETAVAKAKLPMSSVEIRGFAIKVPVKDLGKAKTAMQVRDKLTQLTIEGKGARIIFDGQEILLSPTALQRAIKGAAVHTTSDIRAFLYGCWVKYGKEGGLFLSPSLHTNYLYRHAANLPKEAMPGAIIIRDPAILAKLAPSGKTYRGTVEIERLLKVGIRLPPVKQLLFTRTLAGEKVWLAVIGEPLTRSELRNLKLIGMKDMVRNIFTSAYQIKAAPSAKVTKLSRLSEKANTVRASLKTYLKAGKTTEAQQAARQLKVLDREMSRVAREIRRDFEAQRPLGFLGLHVGTQTVEEAVYRDYIRSDPRGFYALYRRLSPAAREVAYRSLTPQYRAAVLRATGLSVPRAVGRAAGGAPRAAIPRAARGARGVSVPTIRGIEPVKAPAIPLIPIPGTDKSLTPEEFKGSVAWRQGFIYKLIYPPYGEDNIINTREPIPGVKLVRGVRSAYLTLVKLKGPEWKVPDTIQRDMGAMDIHIFTPKEGKGKPRIYFKPDPRQRTKLTPKTGMGAMRG